MLDSIKALCELNAPSGGEAPVREYILSQIKDYAECKVDVLGNIIAFKKGKKPAKTKLMLCAHMDEVGFIVTGINDDGTLSFSAIGGVDKSVVAGRRVVFCNGMAGIFGMKPVHLCEGDESKTVPEFKDMYIDIGAQDKDAARQRVKPGDTAVFDSDFKEFGDGLICAKALDDRAGCAILIDLIKRDLPCDMHFAFTVMEEIGCKGAKPVTYSIDPQAALIIETTTAADTPLAAEKGRICELKSGPAISFMDGGTVYDREYYCKAFGLAAENNIPCQPKSGVVGGNDAGSVHVSREGVRTLAVNIPCRYLHSANCVAAKQDIWDCAELSWLLACEIAGEEA